MIQTLDKETDEIIYYFFPDAEKLTKQRKGCAADYIINNIFTEVKFDRLASKTGNIFIEIGTELNGERTDSGITLSAKRNYSVIYILNHSDVFCIEARKLLQLAETYGKLKQTRRNANGNRDGFHGVGYILSVQYIKEFFYGSKTV